jgi:hypothetical protein
MKISFAQNLDLQEYTTEQRWERAAMHVTRAMYRSRHIR